MVPKSEKTGLDSFLTFVPTTQKKKTNGVLLAESALKEYEKQTIHCLNRNDWSVNSTRISNDDSIFILASRDDSDHLFTQPLWEAKRIDSENRVSLSIVHKLSASREESNGQNTAVVLR